jgi:hypothetical protein
MHLCLFLTGAAIQAFPPGNSSNIRMYNKEGLQKRIRHPVCSFSVAVSCLFLSFHDSLHSMESILRRLNFYTRTSQVAKQENYTPVSGPIALVSIESAPLFLAHIRSGQERLPKVRYSLQITSLFTDQ